MDTSWGVSGAGPASTYRRMACGIRRIGRIDASIRYIERTQAAPAPRPPRRLSGRCRSAVVRELGRRGLLRPPRLQSGMWRAAPRVLAWGAEELGCPRLFAQQGPITSATSAPDTAEPSVIA